MDGEEVHEVGVGPIHAGVIEPGHFRFSCQGEDVHHLEIQLGFQHRGVEELLLRHRDRPGFVLRLAESIAGDSVIGHGRRFARAMEALGRAAVRRRALMIRVVALELERIAIHLGDLVGPGRRRRLPDRAGRVRRPADQGHQRDPGHLRQPLRPRADRGRRRPLRPDSENSGRPSGPPSTRSRRAPGWPPTCCSGPARSWPGSRRPGIVFPRPPPERIGLVGPAARASGLARDVRADHPYGGYAISPSTR